LKLPRLEQLRICQVVLRVARAGFEPWGNAFPQLSLCGTERCLQLLDSSFERAARVFELSAPASELEGDRCYDDRQ
jgi:hypothetical protein